MSHLAAASEVKFINPKPPMFSEGIVEKAAKDLFGLQGEIKPLYSERDQNFRITKADGSAFVFKISNTFEDLSAIDLQTQALLHFQQSDPTFPVPKVVLTKNGDPFDFLVAEDGTKHIVRALTFIDGNILGESEQTSTQLYNTGAFMARSGLALRGFYHTAANYDLLWDMRQVPALAQYSEFIPDAAVRKAVEEDLAYYSSTIAPALGKMRAQIIHNDGNDHNLVASKENSDEIIGLIDFGDMLHAPLIFDLCVTAGSMSNNTTDPFDAIVQTAIGYDRVLPLEECEMDIISRMSTMRIIQELLIAAKRRHDDPNAPSYIISSVDAYVVSLERLFSKGHTAMQANLRKALRFPVYCPPSDTKPSDEVRKDEINSLLKRRYQSLGNALELVYDNPVHVVRGEGPWITDVDGRRYLDGYNNVPHVGHAHPHVVKAIARQSAALNTNTRYLYTNVVEYAERIAATLPGDLGSCIFVNSGSEANDAAMRLTRALTGKRGAIIVEDAYHGITESIDALSPSVHWGEENYNLPDVAYIDAPNTYRGRFNGPEAGAQYAKSTDDAIAHLESTGKGTAAFMIDCSFSSNGILDPLEGYLPAVVDKVRQAGGMIIADEVQIGFGRSGDNLWGFESQGFMPDIVTLGKPVANGLAMGVVITTPAILEQFGSTVDFFSTFGGNPVACAAAHAVLDVLERENLRESAYNTGLYMRAGFRKLAEKHELIGDVRGQGLFNGVELVLDRKTKEPAKKETDYVKNFMRNNGVLISTDSVLKNVLKIRPPMAFKQEHADIMIDTLDKALSSL